jgi:outer membrane protein assembly factor BamB
MVNICRCVCKVSLATLLGWIVSAQALHAQWSGFLGNQGNPVISTDVIPSKFAIEKEGQPSENIAWRRAIPGRSVSGPIVVNDKVITTSSSAMEGRWGNTTAIDTKSGNIVWQRSIKTTGRPYCHPTSANAAPTPCTDGSRVFSFFSSNDLVCYDLDGNLQWFRSLVDAHPLAGNDIGMSSSPVVADGVVVVCVEGQADSFIAGIDSQSGTTLWELPRPRKSNWSSPVVVICSDGKKLVVAQAGESAIAFDPKTGKNVWELDEKCSTIASSAFVGGSLFLPAGGVKSYRIGKSSDKPTLEWTASRISPSSTSIAVLDSFGIVGLKSSVLVCCDFKGELKWQTRLGEAAQFWSTPLVAGRRMFAADSKGKCFIVDLKEDMAVIVSECDLGAEVLGSPAADSSGVYVRSTDAVWKIQQL